jgi:tetratricopeptide (TPR) repeat protein
VRIAATILLVAVEAGAQYRPPPPSEAAQLVSEGDGERAEAAKREVAGDRPGAEQHYQKAAELYERSLKLDSEGPQAPQAAAGLGAACMARRDYARAVKVLGPFHKAQPDAAQVSFYLGLSLFKLNQFAEAVPVLEPLAKADAPEHFMVHYYLGSYALTQHDGARAVDELSQFLKRRPEEIKAGDAQIEEMIGHGYLQAHKPGDARAAFERSVKLRPSSSAQLGIASALEMAGKSGEALRLVEDLAKREPRNVEVVDRLARMYLAAGQLPRASEVASELVKLQRNAASLLLLGDVKAAQKDWQSAASQYRESLKLGPKAPPPLLGLSVALQHLGKYDEAIAELERASADGNPDILAALGTANRRAGHYQKALEVHGKLQQQLPRDPRARILLGADYFAVGQFDEAIQNYTAALELDPQSQRARHCLALALERRAQLRAGGKLADAALLDLRRAYDLEPSESLTQWLGAIAIGQQKYEEAAHMLAPHATVANPPWQTRLIYAYALLGVQKHQEALAIFESLNVAEARPLIDLGWALANLQLDQLEPAVKRLSAMKNLSPAALTDLQLITVRLAWDRLVKGDVPGATHDLSTLGNLPPSSPVHQLAELVKALIAIENRNFSQAAAGIKTALADRQSWVEPAAGSLLSAYVEYRQGKSASARKLLATAVKQAGGPQKLAFAGELSRAIDEREAEQLYSQSAKSAPRIEKLLKADAASPRTQNNLACVRYRSGGQAQAVATWKTLAPKLPEAELNLGLHALQQEHDAKGALVRFRHYLASGGTKAPQAREWADRLSQIYEKEDSK